MNGPTVVAWVSFEDEKRQVITFAECALCKPEYAQLVGGPNRMTMASATGLVAGHLDYLHSQLGHIELEQFAVLDSPRADRLFPLVVLSAETR